MFREIINRLQGRTKTIDENLSIQEVLALLNGLNGNARGNILGTLDSDNPYNTVRGITLESVRAFVNENFSEHKKGFYKYARHQVYSGQRDEKHYLKLYNLFREASDELTMKLHRVRKSALIVLIVENVRFLRRTR